MTRQKMWKQIQQAFSGLFKVMHVLFLEVTGFLFLVIGALILLSAYKQVRSYLDFGEVSYYRLISALVFGGLMLGFGAQSFFKARGINRG